MSGEIRWYKGEYKVEVLIRSKGNWLVKTLEKMPLPIQVELPNGKLKRLRALEQFTFVTVPRLLWRHPRKCPNCHSELDSPVGNVKVCRRCGTVVYKRGNH